MKKVSPSYRNTYPTLFDAGILTDDIVELQRDFYEKNKGTFADNLENDTTSVDLGYTQFNGTIRRGESPETIVIGGEYGNGNSIQAYTRALGIRAVLGPEASIMLLPNDTLGENNLGLTKEEREIIRGGDASPYTYRFHKLLDTIETPSDQAVHIVGMSLGATTGAALAADGERNISSLTMIEPPHMSGSVSTIMAKFIASGGQLNKNITISKQGIEGFSAIDGPTPIGLAAYGIGSLSPSNLASLGLIRNRDIDYDLMWAYDEHPNITVVSAYGTDGHVSPPEENRTIADKYQPRGLQAFELSGADHSVTNAHAVVAALAKHAKGLSNR